MFFRDSLILVLAYTASGLCAQPELDIHGQRSKPEEYGTPNLRVNIHPPLPSGYSL